MGGILQNFLDARAEFFHAKGLGEMRKVVTLEERVRPGGDDVAGDEKEAAPQGIAAGDEALEKLLADSQAAPL